MDARNVAHLLAAAGRERELEALLDTWERATAADDASFVRIHGPAGIGKTHLLRVAGGRLLERGAAVIEVGGARGGAAESFSLAADLARGLIDLVAARKVGAVALAQVTARLSLLLEGGAGAASEGTQPGDARLELADALAALLRLALPLRPVLLFDDLDAADAASLALLHYLSALLLQPGARGGCLVVFAHRDGPLPQTLSEIFERVPMLQLPLAPLDAEGVRRFLASEEVVGRLIEATSGRPARLEEMLAGPPVDLAARRLAQLGEEGRALLLAAAVLGGRQPASLLGRVAGLADPRVALQRLAAAGFLRMGMGPQGQCWEFARESDREAALAGASAERLAKAHGAAGEALASLDAPPEVVARHFLIAEPQGRGPVWAARAAEQLAARCAFDAAIELYHAALQGPGLDRRKLHLGLSAACEAEGDLLAALRHLGLSRRTASEPERREARSEAARLCVRIGKLAQAARLCERVLEGRTGLDPEDAAAARAYVDQTEIRFLHADYQGAMAAARAGIEATAQPRLRVALRNTLGKALIGLGRYQEAAATFHENRQEAEAASLSREAMLACVNEGVALHRAGDRQRAIELYREGLARGDDRSVVALTYGNLAVLYHETGAFDRALEHYGSALAAFALLRRGEGIAHQGINRARLLLFLGDLASAREGVEHARQEAERLVNPYLVAQARLVRGEIALRAGDALAALDDLDFAHSTFTRLGNPRYRVETTFVRIRALLAVGAVDEARAALQQARGEVQERGGADLGVELDLLAAEVALAADEAAAALESLERARHVLLERPAGVGGGTDLEAPWRLYDLLARARTALDQHEAAAAHHVRARTLLEELRDRVPASHRERFAAVPDRARLLLGEGGEIDRRHVGIVRSAAHLEGPAPAIVGESHAIQRAVRRIRPLGRSLAPVLLRGATGTGKALFAAALHAASPRAALPLVRFRCVAGDEERLFQELFGSAEPGGVTTPGKLEQARGGTLYLDEVADLSPAAQALLGEAVELGSTIRPGSQERVAVDVRLICASSRNLEDLVAAGRFREDLYYLLKGATLELPPLQEREGDVALLATHFLQQRRAHLGEGPSSFSQEALALLARGSWPGNVRELRNLVEAVALYADGEVVGVEAFEAQGEFLDELGSEAERPQEEAPAGTVDFYALAQARGLGVRELRQEVEHQMIGRALEESRGNISEAARLLQMKRSRLSQIVNAEPALAELAARGRHGAADEA